jgi:hypothetical protein
MLIAKLLTCYFKFCHYSSNPSKTFTDRPMKNDSGKYLPVNQDRHSWVLGSFCIFLVKTL